MKAALFAPFLRSLPAILALGSFCGAPAMDRKNVFMQTGMPYDTPNWNVPHQAFSDNETNYLKIYGVFSTGTPEQVKELFRGQAWLRADQPCITYQLTDRINLPGYGGGYMYPLQYAIETGASPPIINAILESGSPKQFKGYDPFKHILNKVVARNNTNTNILVGYTHTLIRHGMSPQLVTPGTSGTEQAIAQECRNNSAQECALKLTEKFDPNRDASNNTEKYEAINKIRYILSNFTPTTSAAVPIAPSTAQAVSSTPTTVTIPLPDLPPAPKLAWHETVSHWCNKPKSGMAKTAVCIFTLAAVAVATKLLYNRLFSKKTVNPTQIIITNKSGTIITVGYKTKSSNDLTGVTLNPDDVRPLDLNVIKLNLIVTEQETAQSPLPINLERYKISTHEKNRVLHITIYKNTGLRAWLSGIPYTYTATWQ